TRSHARRKFRIGDRKPLALAGQGIMVEPGVGVRVDERRECFDLVRREMGQKRRAAAVGRAARTSVECADGGRIYGEIQDRRGGMAGMASAGSARRSCTKQLHLDDL